MEHFCKECGCLDKVERKTNTVLTHLCGARTGFVWSQNQICVEPEPGLCGAISRFVWSQNHIFVEPERDERQTLALCSSWRLRLKFYHQFSDILPFEINSVTPLNKSRSMNLISLSMQAPAWLLNKTSINAFLLISERMTLSRKHWEVVDTKPWK